MNLGAAGRLQGYDLTYCVCRLVPQKAGLATEVELLGRYIET